MAPRSRTKLLATALLCMSVLGATVWGLDTGIRADASPPNLPMPTLGGKQFWADRYIYAGWRIQQHVYTGHFRLLDPRDVRRA